MRVLPMVKLKGYNTKVHVHTHTRTVYMIGLWLINQTVIVLEYRSYERRWNVMR